MKKETSSGPELKKVSIQGISGSFHEIAASKFFKNESISVLECYTFEETIESLTNNKVDYAIMAIENTVAGSLLSNYTLLRESEIRIVGEEYLRIKQNLMALPGQRIEELREVHSHYMAINQCRNFFKQYPSIKLVESDDTALSAREIREKTIYGRGAIAGELAASKFKLDILAEGIETNKRNYTRFLVLARDKREKRNGFLLSHYPSHRQDAPPTKSSLCFSLPHQKGSLANVLTILAGNELNLTKIQSMPIIGQEFNYLFYVDVIFEDYKRYLKSLSEISKCSVDIYILGEYAHTPQSMESIHNN